MSPATLQDPPLVDSLFNVAETETLALFEHLSVEFLEEFDVAITNYERRDNPGSTIITVCEEFYDTL